MLNTLKRFYLLSVCSLALFSCLAFADSPTFPIPDGDIANILLNLATQYKTLGLLGILSLATLLTVQVVKKFVPENWKYKRLTTLAVSIIYSIASGLMLPGSNIVSVLITVFLTSGGAVALYEALKGAGFIPSENLVAVKAIEEISIKG